MTEAISFSDFVINHEWSRNTVRLAQASSGWIRDIAGKEILNFSFATLNLPLLEEWLGGVDRVIYIPTALSDMGSMEKTYQLLSDGHLAYRMTSLFQEVTKFFADSLGAIDCMGMIGVTYLIPCVGKYRLARYGLGIVAGLLALSQTIYDLALINLDPQTFREIKYAENPERKIDVTKEQKKALLTGVAVICGLFFDAFMGCKTLYDPLLDPKDRMGEVPFRVWNTVGTLAKITENYIELQ